MGYWSAALGYGSATLGYRSTALPNVASRQWSTAALRICTGYFRIQHVASGSSRPNSYWDYAIRQHEHSCVFCLPALSILLAVSVGLITPQWYVASLARDCLELHDSQWHRPTLLLRKCAHPLPYFTSILLLLQQRCPLQRIPSFAQYRRHRPRDRSCKRYLPALSRNDVQLHLNDCHGSHLIRDASNSISVLATRLFVLQFRSAAEWAPASGPPSLCYGSKR